MSSFFWRSKILQQAFNIPQFIPPGVSFVFQYYIIRTLPLPVNFPTLLSIRQLTTTDFETPVAINIPFDGTQNIVSFSGQDPTRPQFKNVVVATSP